MDSVVPLRSRKARALVSALIAAAVLGAGVAACALAVVFGIGVEPMPNWNVLLLVIAVTAFTPAVAAVF